jgi:hypothetical protein
MNKNVTVTILVASFVFIVFAVTKNKEISNLKAKNTAIKLGMAEAVKLADLNNGRIGLWDGAWEKTPTTEFYITVTFPASKGKGSVRAFFDVQQTYVDRYIRCNELGEEYNNELSNMLNLVKDPKPSMDPALGPL